MRMRSVQHFGFSLTLGSEHDMDAIAPIAGRRCFSAFAACPTSHPIGFSRPSHFQTVPFLSLSSHRPPCSGRSCCQSARNHRSRCHRVRGGISAPRAHVAGVRGHAAVSKVAVASIEADIVGHRRRRRSRWTMRVRPYNRVTVGPCPSRSPRSLSNRPDRHWRKVVGHRTALFDQRRAELGRRIEAPRAGQVAPDRARH